MSRLKQYPKLITGFGEGTDETTQFLVVTSTRLDWEGLYERSYLHVYDLVNERV